MLNELAERDGMTGLYNRRIFDDYVERLWRQSRREGTGVAIIFVDIDFFKLYNDLYGHQAGDDCLKRIAKCIARGAKRPFDFAARYGGEEFVLVLYGPPDDYARTVPEQIRRDVLELAIPHAGSQAAKHVTVSVGLALAKPGTSRSLMGAIQTADEALYQAKREGRNRVVFKDTDSDDVETGNFRVIQRDLRLASPGTGVRHRGPRLGLRQRRAFLEQLDRDVVRRADERHLAVARRPIDRDARVAQPLAQRVDVVDLVRDVAEVAAARVFLGVPVVRELDRAVLLARWCHENEREAPGFVVDAAHLLQAELVAIEVERLLEIADAHHCMQIPHDLFSLRVVLPRVDDYTQGHVGGHRRRSELTRARIIFVPGLNPKPPPEIYRPQLLRVLLAALGRMRPRAAEWLAANDDAVRARRLDVPVPRRAPRHQRRPGRHRAAARADRGDR